MKSPTFDYVAPASLTEVTQVLFGDEDARPIAGGQSLLPLLGFRLAVPTVLVDLAKVPELSGIETDGSQTLIGAMTRQAAVERSSVVAQRFPVLVEALRNVGYPQIRNRGTIGGSIAHADPTAELPLMMTALDATIHTVGPRGVRRVPASEFFQGPFDVALEPGEIVTAVELSPTDLDWTFLELARRRGDFAIVMVAVGVRMAGSSCEDIRVHIGGSHPVPLRLAAVEDQLRGSEVNADSVRSAAQLAGQLVSPTRDIHGSEQYRRRVSTVLVARGLRHAMQVTA